MTVAATPAQPVVGVNLLWCVPGQVGGSEEYIVRLLQGLAGRDDVGDLAPVLFAPRGFGAAHPKLAEALRLVEAPTDATSRPRRILAEHTWLVRRTAGLSVVHHPGGTIPTRRGHARTVLTLHDLQYLTYPQYFSRARLRYLHAMVPRSVRTADLVTVPTEYVRGTVVEAFGVPAERVLVVPHGLSPTLGAAATTEAELRARYHLGSGPVLVLPAMTHPHKGHAFVLELLARHWTDPALRLVLTGGEGAAEASVRALVDRLGLADRVVRAGRVSAADRDGLLRLAEALVFPSEYEGFGAPVIEAMALGTPVVASDRTCLPEVVDGAGLVLPLELDAWAGALDQVRTRRSELVARGRARAAEFAVAHSAGRLLEAYRRVLS